MLWRREWQTLRPMIAVYAVLSAIGLLAGFRVTLSWIKTFGAIGEKTSHVVNASWPALVARVFNVDLSQPEPAYRPFIVAPTLAFALSLGGVIAIALVSAWAIRRIEKPRRALGDSRRGDAVAVAAGMDVLPAAPASTTRAQRFPCFHVSFRSSSPAPSCGCRAASWRETISARLPRRPSALRYTWGLLLLWATLCVEEERDENVATSELSRRRVFHSPCLQLRSVHLIDCVHCLHVALDEREAAGKTCGQPIERVDRIAWSDDDVVRTDAEHALTECSGRLRRCRPAAPSRCNRASADPSSLDEEPFCR